jgi:hypothetical protein
MGDLDLELRELRVDVPDARHQGTVVAVDLRYGAEAVVFRGE